MCAAILISMKYTTIKYSACPQHNMIKMPYKKSYFTLQYVYILLEVALSASYF